MRLIKVSGIESKGRQIEELAEAVESELNNRVLELKRESASAVLVATSMAELQQGLLLTLIYELPDR